MLRYRSAQPTAVKNDSLWRDKEHSMRRRSFLGILSAAAVGTSQTKEAVLNRPKVPGTLNLRTRRRNNKVSEGALRWDVAQTAIIICDMWDAHTCSLSAQRVVAMAPRMNQVINTARSLGVMIVHAPSDTMKFYNGTPWRERMQRAPMAASPTAILARCGRETIEECNFRRVSIDLRHSQIEFTD